MLNSCIISIFLKHSYYFQIYFHLPQMIWHLHIKFKTIYAWKLIHSKIRNRIVRFQVSLSAAVESNLDLGLCNFRGVVWSPPISFRERWRFRRRTNTPSKWSKLKKTFTYYNSFITRGTWESNTPAALFEIGFVNELHRFCLFERFSLEIQTIQIT